MVIGFCISGAKLLFDSVPPVIGLIGWPVHLFSILLFIFFLRKLALYLGAPKLTARARNLIIAGILFMVVVYIWTSQMSIFFLKGPQAQVDNVGGFMLTGLLFIVLGFYMLIKYLSLLRDLRTIIRAGRQRDNTLAANAPR
jgi:hypothetical protein